jgi:hypothetical protein
MEPVLKKSNLKFGLIQNGKEKIGGAFPAPLFAVKDMRITQRS